MKITEMYFYNGSKERLGKLGLAPLFIEVQQIILNAHVALMEERDANGGKEVRQILDTGFEEAHDWEKNVTGNIDWIKRLRYNRSFIASIGVEIQVSARSDLLIRDLVHIRNALQEGIIEVGIIVAPNNRLQLFLPDRTPSIRDARKYIEKEFTEAKNMPIVLIGIEHDEPGPALKKQQRKG